VRVERISSRQNPIVGEFRALAHSGDHGGRVLLDGEHLVGEAISSGTPIEVAALDDRFADSGLRASLERSGTRVLTVTPAVLDAMSPVRQPSGIVAIAACGPSPLERVLAAAPQLVPIAADVQDPGNIGAIVRAAEAAGATGLIAGPGCADPFGWKALRGSMGSALRLPIVVRVPIADAVSAARSAGLRVLAMVPRGGTPLHSADLRAPSAVLLGSEGPGLAQDAIDAADETIAIPMRAPVESLNVATAAAIVLFEAARQRGLP
jgi:RNA methyltransferase, TrmH family